MSHTIVDSGEFIIALPVGIGCREKKERCTAISANGSASRLAS